MNAEHMKDYIVRPLIPAGRTNVPSVDKFRLSKPNWRLSRYPVFAHSIGSKAIAFHRTPHASCTKRENGVQNPDNSGPFSPPR